MSFQQKIACPSCSAEILFDVTALLQGITFSCDRCGAKIGLSGESQHQVTKSMDQFEKLKKGIDNKSN